MLLKKYIYKILKKIFDYNHSDSKTFIKYLRKNHVSVGDYTYFFNPRKTIIDIKNGKFITIGSNCKITQGVVILAHDFSYSILRPIYNEIPKKCAETIIGDNVFVGINSIILMGSKIGNNCIIGAGSVVSGKIPDNEVWAGNPARFICTLDDYYKKCKSKYEDGAILTVKKYREKLKRNPTIQELHFFSLLFLNNDISIDAKEQISKMPFHGDKFDEVVEDSLKYKSKYDSYDDFIKSIK